MRTSNLIYWLGACGVLCMGVAEAGTGRVDLVYPTRCETGEAISACPVTGVKVFQRSSPTGPVVKTYDLPVGRLSMPLTDLPPGQVCISALAITNGTEGPESVIDPATSCKPVGVTRPGVITLTVTITLTSPPTATVTTTQSP